MYTLPPPQIVIVYVKKLSLREGELGIDTVHKNRFHICCLTLVFTFFSTSDIHFTTFPMDVHGIVGVFLHHVLSILMPNQVFPLFRHTHDIFFQSAGLVITPCLSYSNIFSRENVIIKLNSYSNAMRFSSLSRIRSFVFLTSKTKLRVEKRHRACGKAMKKMLWVLVWIQL